MNIDKVDGYTHPKQLSTGRKVGGVKRFEQILNDAVDSVVHVERAADEVSSVKGVALPTSRDLGHGDHLVLQQAYTIVDLLEKYSKALGDPDMTLKGIEPVVTRIEQELKGLVVQCTNNLGQDDELVSIVNHIAVTASVEAFKFQRGDYLT